MAGQFGKLFEAAHHLVGINSEINQTCNLIDSVFMQNFSSLGTVVESSDQAKRTVNIIGYLTYEIPWRRSIYRNFHGLS